MLKRAGHEVHEIDTLNTLDPMIEPAAVDLILLDERLLATAPHFLPVALAPTALGIFTDRSDVQLPEEIACYDVVAVLNRSASIVGLAAQAVMLIALRAAAAAGAIEPTTVIELLRLSSQRAEALAIIARFREEAHQLIMNARQYAAIDRTRVSKNLHRLAGAAGAVGALKLGTAAHRLEHLAAPSAEEIETLYVLLDESVVALARAAATLPVTGATTPLANAP